MPRAGAFEKSFYVAVLSFTVVLTALLAHGASYSGGHSRSFTFGSWTRTSEPEPEIDPLPSRNAIYGRAMALQHRYDSRPYWRNPKLIPGNPTTLAEADIAIEHLIPCESAGRAINRIDTNGKMSYGILQFQDWPEWERVSGIVGDPDNTDDAIRMAEWGIQNGMIDHWGCARILGEI